MRNSLKFGFAVAALALGVAPQAQAQTSGNINATVTVLSALTLTGTPLAFGNIAPTQNKTVAVTDAGAGRFAIKGSNSAAVTFSLTTLPANFGAGSNITIGSWTGYHNSTASASSGGTAFTPSAGYSGSYTLNATGDYYVYLGASIAATAAPVGSYTATVSASVIYN